MKCDIDLENGTVRAEFSLAEFEEIMAALQATRGKAPAVPAPPPVFQMWVKSETTIGLGYQTRIWFDIAGNKHGSCECKDHTCRKTWCKHLVRADRERELQLRLRAAALS